MALRIGRRRLCIAVMVAFGMIVVALIAIIRVVPYFYYCTGTSGALLAQAPYLFECTNVDSVDSAEFQLAADLVVRLPVNTALTVREQPRSSVIMSIEQIEMLILCRRAAKVCNSETLKLVLNNRASRRNVIGLLGDCYDFWKMVFESAPLNVWDLLWRMDRQEARSWQVLAAIKLDDPRNQRGVVLVECESLRAFLQLGTQTNPNDWRAVVWDNNVVFDVHIRGQGGAPLVVDDVSRVIGSFRVVGKILCE